MLITDKYGMAMLDSGEALLESKEKTKIFQKNKGLLLHKQDELEDHVLSQGKRMHWKEFLRILEKANPRLLIKGGTEGNIAVYRLKRSDEDQTPDSNAPGWYNAHSYVTGFPCTWLPEFSSITTDSHGVAKREIRGWRSVLMALIKARALTYNDAKRHFGEPMGARGWRWHTDLHKYKG
jgi:hypothetical protein